MRDFFHAENYKKVLEFLSDKNLLKQNQAMLSKLDNPELGCCSDFLAALTYIDSCGLLNQESLARCIEITQKEPKLYDPGIFKLLIKLEPTKIGKEQLDILFHLKKSNHERLSRIVDDLSKANLLDSSSFSKALKRITEKLPSIVESTAVRKSRHKTKEPRSETILDSKISVFSEPDKKSQKALPLSGLKGASAPVKRGFNTSQDKKPAYIIKTIGRDFVRRPKEDLREAQREVQYNRLFGRPAFYFFKEKNKNPRVVAEFEHGKEVSDHSKKEIQQASFKTRLRCIASGLSDLNTLHSHYRVHGDISQRNFMLNLEEGTMKLIDFGSSHKMGSSHLFETNPVYDDNTHLDNDFFRDLYATGIVIMQLFPELYELNYDERSGLKINLLKKSDLTPIEQAVVNLVGSLMHSDLTKRCTSESALSYCNKIIANIGQLDELDEKMLTEIVTSTINRSNQTVEDVLRGIVGKNTASRISENQRAKFCFTKDWPVDSNYSEKLKNLIENCNELEDIKRENDILDQFTEKSISGNDFEKLLESLLPEQQKKLLEVLGQKRLVKLTKYSFKLTGLLKILSASGQACLIKLLGNKHLQTLTNASFVLEELLCCVKPASRSVLLESLGKEKITNLFPLTSFLVDIIEKLQNHRDAVMDLLQVLGDEPILHIMQSLKDYKEKPATYHRFDSWQGIYDLSTLKNYFNELEQSLLKDGYNHVLKIFSVNDENNKTIDITYHTEKGWTLVSQHLPSFAIVSKDTERVANEIFSLFDVNKDKGVIEFSTQFSIDSFLKNSFYDFPKKQQDIADQQVLNSLSFLDTEEKRSLLQKAFYANNKNLCEKLIDKGVDFYVCKVEKAISNPETFDTGLFNSLCESQAEYNIKKLRVIIFDTNWQIKFGGKTITDTDCQKSNKVPTTVALEWNEVRAVWREGKTYHSAWIKIVELRKKSAKENQDRFKFLRGEPAKRHYQDADDESPILRLK